MKQLLGRLWNDDDGQDLIEYALLIIFIAMAVMAAMPPVTTAITGAFTKAGTCLTGGGCGATSAPASQ